MKRALNFMNKSIPISPLNAAVIASYSLNSDGTDAKNGYNGTVGSSVTFGTGVSGNCAIFNATTNSYITVADNAAFTFADGAGDLPFTIAFDIYITDKSTIQTPFSKGNNHATNNDEYNSLIFANDLYFIMADKTSPAGNYLVITLSLTPYSINTWYHIIYTYDGSKNYTELKMYVNNVYIKFGSQNGIYTGMDGGTAPFNFGMKQDTTWKFNGKLDRFNIFNKVLDSTERATVYAGTYPF